MPTIAEVREKFPQYADLNDEQLAKGLHAKFYSDVPFDDFSKQIGLSAKPVPAAAVEPDSGIGRKLGLGARAAYEGVTMLPEMAENLGVGARNMVEQGVNRFAPGLGKAIYSANSKIAGALPEGKMQDVVSSILPSGPGAPYDSASQVNREGLTGLGAPEPQTSGEHYMSAGIRGAAGALAGGAGLGNMAGLGGMARTALPGVTGGLSAEAARQGGAGPAGQMVAGLAGGFTPASVEELTRLAGTTAANIVRPMLRSGQEQIAANVMGKMAKDPIAAAARLDVAVPVVPGSARTAGEASQDIGLMQLEKGVRARNASAFGTRISEQNAARQAEMQDLGGSPADLAAAKVTRDAVTTPMRESALNPPKGAAPVADVHQTIDTILASPVGKRETVSKSLEWAKGLIGGETNPAALYEIRKDIQLAQLGKLQPSSQNAPNASTLALARGQLGDVISSLDDAIETAAPGFKAYLARYKDMSKPIDQMKVIQEIQKRAELTSADVTTGQNFIGNATFSRALDAAVQKNGAKLTPTQTQRLEAIRTDLQYGQAINSPLIKTPGSDTFQNLSIAQVIGAGATSPHPALRMLMKPLDWVYKKGGTDEAVNQILADAMLDPKLAAAMLRRATPASVQSFSGALRVRAVQNAVGTAAGLGSSLQAPSADRNMSRAPQ